MFSSLPVVLASCSGGSFIDSTGLSEQRGLAVPPVAFGQVTGIPQAKLSDLKTALGVSGSERDIDFAESNFYGGQFSVSGSFESYAESTGVRIVYQWQLRDSAGTLIQTIDGDDNAGVSTGSDPWSAVSSVVLQRIAKRTTETMAGKLAELGYGTKLTALYVPPAEYFVRAGTESQREIDFETLNGPNGAIAGYDMVPPPDDDLVDGETVDPLPGENKMVAAVVETPEPEAQPPVEAETGGKLAKSEAQPVEQNTAKSDLPQGTSTAAAKPRGKARVEIRAVALMPVKGSPGGGDAELTAAMRKTLTEAGWPVVSKPSPDALTIVGMVKVANKGTVNQSVSVRWVVQSPDGKTLGDVKQANDVPKGALDRGWGPTAYVVAEAAAGGIFDIVKRFQ
jgi:hypothetical protein